MAKKRFFTKLFVVFLTVALLLPKIFLVASATTLEVTNETINTQRGVVTASSLNLREGPTTSSKALTTLPRGTIVDILEDVGDWLYVKYGEDFGYLSEYYVGIVYANGVTTTNTLIVRSEPSKNSSQRGSLYLGTRVSIIREVQTEDENNPIWYEITYKDGESGYVSANYVKIIAYFGGIHRRVGLNTAKVLNLREDTNLFSRVAKRIPQDSYFVILETKDTTDYYKKWHKIDYNGQIGWVAARYVKELEWNLASTSSTSSPGSGKNRNHNMSLASNCLTGTIVFPGEKFSWIKIMGNCSINKGFSIATVYSNGQVSEGAGGGVCQVSTTTNMAIKKLDIPTNARQHSLPVSYAARKDEASVSYPNVDFSFTNTLDTPILVELVSKHGTVVCNVYTAE